MVESTRNLPPPPPPPPRPPRLRHGHPRWDALIGSWIVDYRRPAWRDWPEWLAYAAVLAANLREVWGR